MRTTLTLEPEVSERLRAEMALGKKSFKEVVNEALRRGLGIEVISPAAPFRVIPHSSTFVPGIDLGKLNSLAEELEAAEFLAKHTSE